eukprot:Transcript_14582.p5 GENE.Transcript_14582~~Transcript_14582.p5  ORF type:complete len:107 (+),score=16.40 Transcript_14582:663-983(+)
MMLPELEPQRTAESPLAAAEGGAERVVQRRLAGRVARVGLRAGREQILHQRHRLRRARQVERRRTRGAGRARRDARARLEEALRRGTRGQPRGSGHMQRRAAAAVA